MSRTFLARSTVRFDLFLYGSLYNAGRSVCFPTLNRLFFEKRSVGVCVSWPSCRSSSSSALVWALGHFCNAPVLIGSEKCGD